MKTVASLDTSIILRWLLDDMPEITPKVTELLNQKRTFHLSDMAVQEVVYVLEYVIKFERTQIVENIEAIISKANINCNRDLFHKVMPYYLKYPKLSFTDCCLAMYAKLNEATPLITLDKKLALQLQEAEIL